MGRRIGKKVGSVVKKRWLCQDGLNPIAEVDPTTNTLVARYVYGSRPNVPDLVVRGTNTYRLVADQLGSPRAIVNVANASDVPYRADYSAFGEATWKGAGAAALDWLPFGFAGGLYDADTGLVRFGARDYDPSMGRWMSKDPILFDGGQTNLYSFVNDDPVNRTDASGRGPNNPACQQCQYSADEKLGKCEDKCMEGDNVCSTVDWRVQRCLDNCGKKLLDDLEQCVKSEACSQPD